MDNIFTTFFRANPINAPAKKPPPTVATTELKLTTFINLYAPIQDHTLKRLTERHLDDYLGCQHLLDVVLKVLPCGIYGNTAYLGIAVSLYRGISFILMRVNKYY